MGWEWNTAIHYAWKRHEHNQT